MHFAHPKIFFLFLVFIPLIVWYVFKQKRSYPAMNISSVLPLMKRRTPLKALLRHSLFVLQLLALACVIIILARPQVKESWKTSSVEGTDIVIAFDISSSMLAPDLKPNRLEAAKEVASRFVKGRENDNMGIVVFAGESLTGVPLTSDRATLTNYLANLRINMIDDGTAIGDGIATAINRLKDGKAKSKSIILLTDGSYNAGMLTPNTAAEIAKEFDIKIYTIGVGSDGMAKTVVDLDYNGNPVFGNQQVQIDEKSLKGIAEITGGKYFRATDNNVLKNIFDEIDSLEKTELDSRSFSHSEDAFTVWTYIGLSCLFLSFILRQTYFRTIP